MTKYVGSFFFVSVLLVSWWSLNGDLVAVWWCVRGVLTVFGDVLGVLLISWWCFCGVGVVSSVFVVFKEWYFVC